MSQKTRNILVISMFSILAGCAADNDKRADITYSTDRVLVDDYGLTLNPSEYMYVDFERISRTYADTMACMGMTADGPTVEYKSFSFAGIGNVWAIYHSVASTVWVNTDEDDILLKRDYRTDIEALKHEFVHHILHKNGASKASRGHSSPLLSKCGIGVNTYN